MVRFCNLVQTNLLLASLKKDQIKRMCYFPDLVKIHLFWQRQRANINELKNMIKLDRRENFMLLRARHNETEMKVKPATSF